MKPGDPAEKVTALQLPDQSVVPTQLVKDETGTFLAFVLPKIKAGEKLAIGPVLDQPPKAPHQFKFVEGKDLL